MKKRSGIVFSLYSYYFQWVICLVLVIIEYFIAISFVNNEVKTMVNQDTIENKLVNAMIFSIKDEMQNVCLMISSTDQLSKMEQYNIYKDNQQKYDQAWRTLQKINPTAGEETLYTQINNCRQKTQPMMDRLVETKVTVSQTVTDPSLAQIDQEVNKWTGLLEQIIQSNKTAYEKAKANTKTIFIIYILIGFISGVFSEYSFNVRLKKYLFGITNLVQNAIQGLKENAAIVSVASNQLAVSAQQLSHGCAEQASAIEETSSTLQESALMHQQNTDNTKQAMLLSEQAKEAADKGNHKMQEMMDSMHEIKKSSDQIAKIIKMIDDIAFQTNILALNAAVEAAQAGEAGMGFAVVAEEVRNLAQRSAQAVKDTAVIIEANIELSGRGVTVAERVREVLNEIMVQAKKVNELMSEIAMASVEQAQEINQVGKAIIQSEKVTERNVAGAEESATAAGELKNQVESIKEMIRDLTILVNGSKAVIADDDGGKIDE